MNPSWGWLLPPATYLLASISPAYLIAKLKGIDLRSQGSGNLGATNAGRVMGMRYFFLVFALDVLKGLLPVLLAQHLVRHGAHALLPAATGLCALLGHSFTCFHRFKGGKAVATSLGLLIGMAPLVALIASTVWLLTWCVGALLGMAKSQAVTPASVMSALAVPSAWFPTDPSPWAWSHLPTTVLCLAMSILVLVRHRGNVQRLFQGQPRAARPGGDGQRQG
jgi:glycerol-3-phosphate acyltransferase PlsY